MNNPKLLYIIFTHNRPAALNVCINSLFNKQDTKPDRVIIIDDSSESELKDGLFKYSLRIKADFYSHFSHSYGASFEKALKLCEEINPKFVAFVESDYEFSENGIDKVMELMESDIGNKSLLCSLTDHPDYFSQDKIKNIFPTLAAENGLIETRNFDLMYKPRKFNNSFYYEYVSNTCGCVMFNWGKMMELKGLFPDEYLYWFNKSVDKHKSVRYLNDGNLSVGASLMWDKAYPELKNKYGAIVNLKPSVGNHWASGGINGKLPGFEELTTFVGSPTFGLTLEEYNQGKRMPIVRAYKE